MPTILTHPAVPLAIGLGLGRGIVPARLLLAPALVDRRDPQPGVTRLERVHPLVDRYARPLNSARHGAPVVRPRLVVDPGLAKQRVHTFRVLGRTLTERQLPGRVLQDLGQQRAVDGFEV